MRRATPQQRQILYVAGLAATLVMAGSAAVWATNGLQGPDRTIDIGDVDARASDGKPTGRALWHTTYEAKDVGYVCAGDCRVLSVKDNQHTLDVCTRACTREIGSQEETSTRPACNDPSCRGIIVWVRLERRTPSAELVNREYRISTQEAMFQAAWQVPLIAATYDMMTTSWHAGFTGGSWGRSYIVDGGTTETTRIEIT